MSFKFFCHVDTISWHLLGNTGALHLRVMIATYFQIITQIATEDALGFFQSHCIVTIHACHNFSPDTVATGLWHLSFVDAASTIRLVPMSFVDVASTIRLVPTNSG